MKLQGRRALITGTGSGIGVAFAEAFAREGARVAIADLDVEQPAAGREETTRRADGALRAGTTQDLVPMAVFLTSQGSDYIVSQTYGMDGGNWMA